MRKEEDKYSRWHAAR